MHGHGADGRTRILTFYTVKDKEQTKIYPIRKVNSVPSRCTHATHVRRFRLPKCSEAGDREVLEVLFVYVFIRCYMCACVSHCVLKLDRSLMWVVATVLGLALLLSA